MTARRLSHGHRLPDTAQGPDPRGEAAAAGLSLSERFGIAPFSVLNAREGWWQDRKRAWVSLGIQSEIGRGGDVDEPGA